MIAAIIWTISFVVSLLLIGLMVSFSVVLYMALFAALSRSRHPFRAGMLLIGGLATGLLLLALLFVVARPETFHIQTLMTLIGDMRTNTVDMLLSLTCFVSGAYMVYRKRATRGTRDDSVAARPRLLKPKTDGAALIGHGFVRGVTRITGVAALLYGIRVITYAVDQLSLQVLWALVLVGFSMMPYMVIFALKLWRPAVFHRSQVLLKRIIDLRPQQYVGEVLMGVGVLFAVLAFL